MREKVSGLCQSPVEGPTWRWQSGGRWQSEEEPGTSSQSQCPLQFSWWWSGWVQTPIQRSTLQTRPQNLLLPCLWCRRPEASWRPPCRGNQVGRSMDGRRSLSHLTWLFKLTVHRDGWVFISQGRDVLRCEAVSIHVVDPGQVVDVGRVVEQLARLVGDEVAVHHRGQLDVSYCWNWR